MKRMLIFMMALCCAIASWTQDYKSLDAKQPIEFKGDRIVFSNQEIILGPKAFFIDGQYIDWSNKEGSSITVNGKPYSWDHALSGSEFIDLIKKIADEAK